ncbi:MAG: alkaline D-peptidase [Nocardia sp.]|uniref:serine hydrolase domain-containing protein n=1 Tax=Nocardia sp. TaxID=1821 RepID=UPI002605CC41|nr:serine hydrolase domain-containing protein [Nocardia sp.]MCU1640304.1 alkaline D-peptidase [Nocardia sp.]
MSRAACSPNRAVWSRRLWLLPAVSSLVVGLAACTSTTTTPDATTTQLTKLARQLVDAGAPGVIVRVTDGHGKTVEIAEQAPWTQPDGKLDVGDEFRMGSNTKTLLATLTLQLVAEGKLALTDPVQRWLPGQVPNGEAITLRMLLNHTSGLFDYTNDPAVLASMLGKDQRQWASAELIALATQHEPLFAPGTEWSYSNTDYTVVGALLEQVTGKSLAALIHDRIAAPLHLQHTYFPADATWQGRYAHGYEPDPAHMPADVPAEYREVTGSPRDGYVDVSANNPSWGGAAGAIVSTAQDWPVFYTALMSGKLLPAAQLAEMRTTVSMDPDNPQAPRAGLGIQTASTSCGTIWAHEGGITGYSSVNLTDDTGQRSASVLVPTDFPFEFAGDPKLSEAYKTLYTSTLCVMFDKPAEQNPN